VAVLRPAQLAPLFESLNCFVQTQQPISLPPLSEPEPDAAVVRRGIDDYLDHPPAATDVLCVIEVADSSSRDVGPKLATYAGAGIAHCVVVHLVNNRVLSHEQPGGNVYARVISFVKGEIVQLSAGSGQPLSLAVDRLLP
jgi:Uma2 family endonuclease